MNDVENKAKRVISRRARTTIACSLFASAAFLGLLAVSVQRSEARARGRAPAEAQSLPPPPTIRWPEIGVMANLIAYVPKKFDPNSSKIIFFDNIPNNTQFSPPGATVTFPFHAVSRS